MSSSIVDIRVARINTTVTENANDINRLVRTFLSNNNNKKKIIGLDTERAQKGRRQIKNFKMVGAAQPIQFRMPTKTALLQLCDGDHCLIVQLPIGEDAVEIPLSLFNFLNLPDFTFVGVGINKSLMMLENEFGFTCKNSVEIGPASWNLTKVTPGLKYLMDDIVPTQNPMSPIFDDWGTFELNKNQIKLAVSNAYLAFGMGNVLLDGFGV